MSTSGKLRTASKIHDIWADSQTCDISTSVVLRGQQDVRARRGEDSRGKHIVCQFSRVLVYLFDPEAVTSHVTTWMRAENLAIRAFPADYVAKPPRNSKDPERPLSVGSVVLQCEREQRPVRADAATTAAAELPYVQVQVGRLIVVCLDHVAFNSCLEGWKSAAVLAEAWLPDPDAAREERRIIASFERNWTRAKEAELDQAPAARSTVDLTAVARRLRSLESRVLKLEQQLGRSATE